MKISIEKFQAKMGPGLRLKIWSNFQAKSQTTLVAKFFFCLKWIWKHFKQLLNFSHFTQCKMCKVKYFTTRILRDLRFTTCKSTGEYFVRPMN